ncbi:AMP-binding protein, partial [Teredinibacter waterburyi]|uniref:AMP-binding protein n=1 Tax=Teredinibacter waterburyi TaxID=1500538 RepID=UPI00165EFD08
TSGSTGKPKGVQLSHRSLVNFLCSMQKQPGIKASDSLLALTTICFDIAALEIFLPLLFGARVVIRNRETSMLPDRIVATLEDQKVTIMQATPVTWRMLIEHGWQGEPKIKILCGGEAMGLDLAENLLATGCEVWNLYGPTETTIWSSVKQVCEKEDALYVGLPIANTDFYIFSEQQTLQPIGVPGELMIGGDGLARGYFNRPELTAEKFIVSPLDSRKRLYRTGDLAQRKADGSIEFLGRIDNQVKIRGFRIELGEIETRLSAHAAIGQCVTIAREDEPGNKKLVAYYIAAEGEAVEPDALRAYLKESLPDYMIPAHFVCLPSFPQT